MNVEMLVVPYDSGHENVRMGRGPQRFLEFGLAERLRDSGHEVRVRSLRSEAPFRTEVTTAYELNGSSRPPCAQPPRPGASRSCLRGTATARSSLRGLRVGEMAAVLDAARARFEMAAVTLAAYDPGCDANGAAVAAGTRFVTQLLAPNSA